MFAFDLRSFAERQNRQYTNKNPAFANVRNDQGSGLSRKQRLERGSAFFSPPERRECPARIKMKCLFCDNSDTRVIDSRPTEEGYAIRRRRECDKCARRFTTYEKVEEIPLMVIKKDGSREAFDRNKIMNGIIKACEKRPVSIDAIEKIVSEIERGLNNMMEKEMDSARIGQFVMDYLKDVDEVAYVRFASVYRQFTDVNTFISEIESLLKSSNRRPAAKTGEV